MSAIAEKLAVEHHHFATVLEPDGTTVAYEGCACGWDGPDHLRHVIDVTVAAAREQILGDIKAWQVEHGYIDTPGAWYEGVRYGSLAAFSIALNGGAS